MDVCDVGFVATATIIQRIELAAGVKDINFQRVHSYKLSLAGRAQKKRIVEQLQKNQRLLCAWAGGQEREENILVLARSMYLSNSRMLATCRMHLLTINSWLEQQDRDN